VLKVNLTWEIFLTCSQLHLDLTLNVMGERMGLSGCRKGRKSCFYYVDELGPGFLLCASELMI
jgi:hypothetical protein